MNIYIEQKKLHFFLENLKENDNIDDFILDKAQFGKQKITIKYRKNEIDVLNSILKSLPLLTTAILRINKPGKGYFLCVGEIPIESLKKLKALNILLAIITIKEKTVRLNFWVKCEDLEKLFNEKIIKNFSTIHGKVKTKSNFIFEFDEDFVNEAYKIISNIDNGIIIEDNKMYVKLLLSNFSTVIKELNENFLDIQLVD